jgi:GNAT superfamily N-acetyltransferase
VTPTVRLATTADAEPCGRLEEEARTSNSGGRGASAFFAENPTAFHLADDGGATVVAEVDSVIVGFATLHFTQVDSERVARIVRIFVTPPARRVGVGDALITAAKSAAREQRCTRIDALSLPGDRETKNLFERNGLTARLIVAASAL